MERGPNEHAAKRWIEMPDCEKQSTCPFFNDRMENMPAAATLLKLQYCQGDFESCARFRVETKLGSTSVPGDLLPDESATADVIVAGT
jgi:hypothetical protein